MSMCDYCIHHDCKQPQWHINAVINGDMYCQAFKSWLKRNISMSHVTASFCAERKSITRRNWANVTIRQFHQGTKALVWNKQSRFGGEPIGVLELTENPFKQNTNDMPLSHYVEEGFEYLDDKHTKITYCIPVLAEVFMRWKKKDDIMTVVPFMALEVFPGMKDKYTTDEEIIRCVKALVKAIG